MARITDYTIRQVQLQLTPSAPDRRRVAVERIRSSMETRFGSECKAAREYTFDVLICIWKSPFFDAGTPPCWNAPTCRTNPSL
jgi:hypothetical protein